MPACGGPQRWQENSDDNRARAPSGRVYLEENAPKESARGDHADQGGPVREAAASVSDRDNRREPFDGMREQPVALRLHDVARVADAKGTGQGNMALWPVHKMNVQEKLGKGSSARGASPRVRGWAVKGHRKRPRA